MNVQNIISNKTNREIPNQFIIKDNGITYFQSYKSIIVKIENDKTFLDVNYWDFSNTTRKYRNQFLGETSKEIKDKIQKCEYLLIDLN